MIHWITDRARKAAAFLAVAGLLGLCLTAAPIAAAQNSGLEESRATAAAPARIINRETIPERPPQLSHLHRVAAAKTPSGFVVPRYVSLKFGKTNGRSGPSQNHPIVWQYRRKGLPVIVIAETENWRKVKDINGDESWVYRAGLAGERHVLSLRETVIYKKARSNAPAIAIAEKGSLLRLEKCENLWCRVFATGGYRASGGYRGWVSQYDIWGANALYE